MTGWTGLFHRGLAAVVFAGALAAAAAGMAGEAPPGLELGANDRLLILAPHPDDEVLSSGGLIQHALQRKLPVHVAFLTYGDNNQWAFLLYRRHPVVEPAAVRDMGLMRHEEALAAARALGLAPEALTFLGYPDFRTLAIWARHWDRRPPAYSMLTRVAAVPYTNALSPGAPYKGESVLADLKTVLRSFRPTRIMVSHPADHNPDHQALYLFTRVALWDLEQEVPAERWVYLIHSPRWPVLRGDHATLPLAPPPSLAAAIPWQTAPLTAGEIAIKRAALQQHRSQMAASAGYLLSFLRANELAGDFPDVRLVPEAAAALLAADNVAAADDEEQALTQEEEAAYVELDQRRVRSNGQRLTYTVALSRPLGRGVDLAVDLFGYRPDRPFAAMPKICVRVGLLGYTATDQDVRLPLDEVVVRRRAREIELDLPLSLLGNPDRILTSAQIRLSAVPLDWVPWRCLDLRPAPDAAGH